MSTPLQRTAWTYEDYLGFPDDGRRHEIIEGEHYVTPSPRTKHQMVVLTLGRLLDSYARQHHAGRVFVAPYDVILSDIDIVQPDVLFVAATHASMITEKHIQGAPDLVIEVLSDSTRKTDEITKRKLYERAGVAEYWVVDPELERVKVFRRQNSIYERVVELSAEAGESVSSSLLPGLTIHLPEIFE